LGIAVWDFRGNGNEEISSDRFEMFMEDDSRDKSATAVDNPVRRVDVRQYA